jgi:hypothetical protein
MLGPKDFVYQDNPEGYICPQGQVLTYATTDRDGYRHYNMGSDYAVDGGEEEL